MDHNIIESGTTRKVREFFRINVLKIFDIMSIEPLLPPIRLHFETGSLFRVIELLLLLTQTQTVNDQTCSDEMEGTGVKQLNIIITSTT